MIVVDATQGSQEWVKARLGLPTASQFHRILTPKTLKPSSQAHLYMCELIAAKLLGMPLDGGTSDWMQRGNQLEESARHYYEFQRDCDVTQAGFCLRDDRLVGCSPDGLIGDDGGLEIKCPNAGKHISHLLIDFEAEYKCQVQGCLWICKREWWDLISYNPALPSRIIRCYRDEPFIKALEVAVNVFCEKFAVAYETIKQQAPDILDEMIAQTAHAIEKRQAS